MYNNFVLLFSRLTGFFLISPLFAQKGIPKSVRFGLALASSLLLAPPFTVHHPFNLGDSTIALHIVQQLVVGYLMGFLCALFVEAAAFAGQLIGALMGFSLTELLSPLDNSTEPLLSKLFSLVAFALFFALDLHHPLLRLLYGSFDAFPVLHNPLSYDTIQVVLQGTSLLFTQAITYAALPLTFLLALIALFAVVSRFLPIFWIGFPLQLLVGFLTLMTSFSLFITQLEKNFLQFWSLLKNLVVHL